MKELLLSDKIEIVLISYKFNFMAERAIETIGFPVRVIHSGKTKEQIDDFRSDLAINEYTELTKHWQTIERVLNEKDKPEYVLFIDHDMAWMQNSFIRFYKELVEIINTNKDFLIARPYLGGNLHDKIFATVPCFVVKRSPLTKNGWKTIIEEDKVLDTGRDLVLRLKLFNKKYIINIELPYIRLNDWHIGSLWLAYDRKTKKTITNEQKIQKSRHIFNIMTGVGFSPREPDIKEMKNFILFDYYFDRMDKIKHSNI